jgi:hypothetical protein
MTILEKGFFLYFVAFLSVSGFCVKKFENDPSER